MKRIVFSLLIVTVSLYSCKENTTKTQKTEDSIVVEAPIEVKDTINADTNTTEIDSVVAKSQETAKVKFQRIDQVAK
ncbi:hypothetical protein [Flavobacterium sp.]|uniref:hypothetical protein n=1 Tax=Flavobacterium sp. TaxID=239 RepID=UPI0040485AB9